MTARAGHRLVPHTADCIIEAWGPDRPTCFGEALAALVDEFAERYDAPCTQALALRAGRGQPEDVLVSLLEEVIYTVDVRSVLPVRFHLTETMDGALVGDMEVVPLEQARITGPAPKAVAYHGLSVTAEEGRWRCRALIDV